MTAPTAADAWLLAALAEALDSIGPAGTQSLRSIAAAVTPLGGTPMLTAIVATAAAGLTLRGRRIEAGWLVLTVLTAWALMHGLKLAFGRARPDAAGHLVEAVGAALPSGHAMMSLVVTLALWRTVMAGIAPRIGPRLAALARMLAGLLVLAIGTSRVLLGVHWPTDVLAGWACGAAWAALATAGLTRLRAKAAADD